MQPRQAHGLPLQPSRTVTVVHWITSFRKRALSQPPSQRAIAGLFSPSASRGAHRPSPWVCVARRCGRGRRSSRWFLTPSEEFFLGLLGAGPRYRNYRIDSQNCNRNGQKKPAAQAGMSRAASWILRNRSAGSHIVESALSRPAAPFLRRWTWNRIQRCYSALTGPHHAAGGTKPEWRPWSGPPRRWLLRFQEVGCEVLAGAKQE